MVENTDPGALKIAGDQTLLYPPGVDIVIRDNSNSINGNHVVQHSSYDSGEVISEPVSTLISRAFQLRPNLWTQQNNLNLLLSGDNPPGVSSDNWTNPGGTVRVANFILSRVSGGSAIAWMRQAATNGANGGVDPDPSSPGGPEDFNDSFNRHTFYVRATSNGPSQQVDFRAGFVSGVGVNPSTFHGVNIQMHSGTIQSRIDFNGAVSTSTSLGDRWFKIQIVYQTGTGSNPSLETDELQLEYQLQVGSLGSTVQIVHGDGQLGSEHILRYNTQTTVTGVTTLVLDDELVGGVSFTGEVCVLGPDDSGNQGANGAHIINQLLFETAPHGAGIDQNCYDPQSLRDLGVLLDAGQEGLRSHSYIPQGNTIQSAVQFLLTEIGANRVWSTTDGLWHWKAVRPENPLGSIPADMLIPDPPEKRKKFGSRSLSRLVMSFPSEALGFRTGTVPIPGDDTIQQSVELVTLRTVRDEEAATVVGERYSLVEMSKPTAITVVANRNAEVLRVGDLLDFGELLGIDLDLRVMSMQLDPLEPGVQLTLVTDPFAQEPVVARSLGVQPDGRGVARVSAEVPSEDEEVRIHEISGFLSEDIRFLALRIPSDPKAKTAAVLTSFDDSSYTTEASSGYYPAGYLAADFELDRTEDDSDANAAVNKFHLEQGPLISAANDSFSGNTLTLSEADWRAGRQRLLINGEVLFVRQFISLGGNLWQALGVIRQRFETQRQGHSFGDACFVVLQDDSAPYRVPTANRGANIYTKVIPSVGTRQTPPASVTAVTTLVQGKALRPLPLQNLTTSDFTNSYVVGNDLTLRWDYRLHSGWKDRTGSGMQGYGEGNSAGSSWPGSFLIAIGDSTGTIFVVPTTTVTTNSFTITAAELSDALTASGVSGDLQVQVTPVNESGELGDRLITTLLEV